MGARLVAQVLTRWTHVSDRSFRVLVRMALTALDEPNNGTPAGLYFGGRDLLAMTLRNERGGSPESVLRVVRLAITELIDAGAIERTHAGRAGQNAVYQLRLDGDRSIDQVPVGKPTSSESQGESHVPPEGESHVPPQGESHVPERGNPTFPPRNHEEPVEELYEERKLDLRTAVTGPCVRDAAEEPDSDVVDQDPEPGPLRLVAGNPDAQPGGRGIWPAPVPDEPEPAADVPAEGLGFCVPCYRTGQTVLAADPDNGSQCAYHLRSA